MGYECVYIVITSDNYTDLWLVVTDPLRAGHEERYYPGDINFRAADVVVINKANSASAGGVEQVRGLRVVCEPHFLTVYLLLLTTITCCC